MQIFSTANDLLKHGPATGRVELVHRRTSTRFGLLVNSLAPYLRPVIDRYYYGRMFGRAELIALNPADADNPFVVDVPYRSLLSWSFPLGIFAAHHDLAPL